MRISRYYFFLFALFLVSCGEEKQPVEPPKPVEQTKVKLKPLVTTPPFSGKNAYDFVEAQVKFGPRVPNTKEHAKCADYLVKKLHEFGLDTMVQRGDVIAYNNKTLHAKNIIGRFAPEKNTRIMLYAHWDSRPYADRDTDKRTKPIDGANDGASGVGVLLELARAINESHIKPGIGFDIIFFDAEDYGQPDEAMVDHQSNTWCLGSQYFANNIPFANYHPKYGILLDMVGAKDAVFPREGVSIYFASDVVDNVWRIAKQMGHQKYFTNGVIQGGLTDDHTYINQIAKIPSIDIIHYEVPRRDFGKFHHTHNDNLSIIDSTTLKVVGETVLQVLYQEQ